MPTVPQYALDNNAAKGIRGPRVTAEDFGARTAQTIQKAGEWGLQATFSYAEAQQRLAMAEDDLAVKDTLTKALSQVQTRYRDVTSLEGVEGLNALPEFDKELDAIGSDYASVLTPRQKEKFLSLYQERLLGYRDNLYGHQINLTKKHQQQTWTGQLNQTISSAGDMALNGQALSEGEAAVIEASTLLYQGEAQELRDFKTNENLEKYYTSGFNAVLAQDPAQALAYLDQYSNKFNPEAAAGLRSKAESALESKTAKELASGLVNMGATREQAVEEAEKLQNPGLKDRMLEEFDTLHADRQAKASEEAKVRLGSLADGVLKNPTAPLPDDLTPDEREVLSDLRTRAVNRKFTSDPAAIEEVRRLRSSSVQEFVKTDLLQKYAGRIAPNTLVALERDRQTVAKALSTGSSPESGGQAFTGKNRAVVEAMARIEEKFSKDDKVNRAHFDRFMHERFEKIPKDKEPTSDELEKIYNEAMELVPVSSKRSWFGLGSVKMVERYRSWPEIKKRLPEKLSSAIEAESERTERDPEDLIDTLSDDNLRVPDLLSKKEIKVPKGAYVFYGPLEGAVKPEFRGRRFIQFYDYDGDLIAITERPTSAK